MWSRKLRIKDFHSNQLCVDIRNLPGVLSDLLFSRSNPLREAFNIIGDLLLICDISWTDIDMHKESASKSSDVATSHNVT